MNEILITKRNMHSREIPRCIKKIVWEWRELQNKIGTNGSMVNNAGFSFTYNGLNYFMTPCSDYKGSVAWENDITKIRMKLKDIGCQNIKYNWGTITR